MAEIKKAAVIGAGVMGAGIAAHLTNAGVPVILFDIVPKDAKNRNAIAEGAIQKLLKTEPAAFMSKRNATLMTAAKHRGRPETAGGLRLDCRSGD